MSGKDKAPGFMVEKTPRGLRPLTAWDEKGLDGFVMGQKFDLAPRRADFRSPLNGKYRMLLNAIAKRTHLGPTGEHLHQALKIDLGYVERVELPSGSIAQIPQSTAFDKMSDEDFRGYYERAVELLARALGCDPEEYLPSLDERRGD